MIEPAPPPPARAARCPALLLGSVLAGISAAPAAQAQFSALHAGPSQPVSRDEPVYYQSDSAAYDRDGGVVTLSGHVEIWQGGRDLRADSVTYDRNTGVAAARGHVVMLDPDGQVTFGDYAELGQGMRDGIVTNLRAQLAENGHLAANGARRTNAQINELSRVIYSTCNVCAQHPEEPPLWDIRARSAVQDLTNKRIEYQDAVLDIDGWPVAYTPYFSQPDPSAKRSSGFLVPSLGISKYLGGYLIAPYYWVIDGATDAVLAPVLATKSGPGLDTQFRHVFNNGAVTVNASVARFNDRIGGDVFAKGQFAIDDEWRWGFDLQRASSLDYLQDFRISGIAEVLTSQVYLEGFGQGSYSRLDARAYQSLAGNIISSQLPYVLPRYEYSFVGEPDALGGRLSVDAGAFNVARQVGTNTQRASLSLNWERPATGALGDLWKLVLHLDSAAYEAHQIDQQPTWGPANAGSTAQAMPSLSIDGSWPLSRDAGDWGTQLVEPIVQLVAAPYGSSYGNPRSNNSIVYVNDGGILTATSRGGGSLIPNEDSLDFEFTDATLFRLNRYPGIDRLEGGPRANVALHGGWTFPDNEQIDAQIGQGYRTRPDRAFPVGSGLEGTVTDIVSHVSYTPNPWLDLLSQQRFSHRDFSLRFADAIASGGPSWLRLSAGYLYSSDNPYLYYSTVPTSVVPPGPRDEISLGASTRYGHWSLSANARRDLQRHKMITAGAGLTYDDECFTFGTQLYRRFVSVNGDNGATTLLFQITLKTVGTFGFHEL